MRERRFGVPKKMKKAVLLLFVLLLFPLVSARTFYQETADSTWEGSNWFAGDPFNDTFDGDWGTFGQVLGTLKTAPGAYNYSNTSLIGNSTNFFWLVKDGKGTQNISLPVDCVVAGWPLRFYVESLRDGANHELSRWWCYNDSDMNASHVHLLRDTGAEAGVNGVYADVYEEGLYFNITTVASSLTLSFSPGSTVRVGEGCAVSCVESHGLGVVLTMDGVVVSNPVSVSPGVGAYSFDCSTAGDWYYDESSVGGVLSVVDADVNDFAGSFLMVAVLLSLAASLLFKYGVRNKFLWFCVIGVSVLLFLTIILWWVSSTL